MIFLFILIPIAFAFLIYKKEKTSISVGYRTFEKNNILPKYLILFGVSLLIIYGVDKLFWWQKVKDTEYLVSYVTQSKFYEAWDEEVPCRHPIKDEDGNTVGHEHSYDVDEHQEEYIDVTNTGREHYIDKYTYLVRKVLWKNEKFVELNRDFHKQDGDCYVTNYDNEITHTINIAQAHEYKNLVRQSQSIYTYGKDVDSSVVYDYPALGSIYVNDTNFPSILTTNRTKDFRIANQLLQSENSKQGFIKQIKYWVCLFPDKPVSVAFEQEKYWEGGNKNEFVTCIGYNSKTNKIDWVKPFAWDNELLKQTIKDSVSSIDSLNLIKIVKTITTNGRKQFLRKPFADFDYLDVGHVSFYELLTILLLLLTTGIIVLKAE